MDVGINFFPDVGPAEKTADTYYDECLQLAAEADRLGFHHIRTVEHYFEPYGGYSPNPIVFLTAVSQRTERVRLVTGAVLPAFNHPLKLAGELGMLDALSHGRLEIGVARAFLPHEFARFGVSMDESRARFEEGIEALQRLLSEEQVSLEGPYHRFPPTTSLPRPVQQPRPPIWVAAMATEQSFVYAGTHGYGVMAIPLLGTKMRPLLAAYRDAWRAAGHSASGRVMLAFHMLCHEDGSRARELARDPINHYLRSLAQAASGWLSASSVDYPGYQQIIAGLQKETFDTILSHGGAWAGSPNEILSQIRAYQAEVGGVEFASMQVNFATLDFGEARRSVGLFAGEVLPYVGGVGPPT